MSSAYKNDGVAFLIGEDYARYGLQPPPDADEHCLRGHATYRASSTRARPDNRYIRKWLQIRFNAWKRNLLVHHDVTPEFLESITTSNCPVSGVPFTYGTGKDSDWSVDRIDNEGAYSPHNIIIITARVNKAKGILLPSELRLLADPFTTPGSLRLPDGFDRSGLEELEWRRLAWLASTSEKEVYYPTRIMYECSEQPQHLVTPICSVVQEHMIDMGRAPGNRRQAFWNHIDDVGKCDHTRGCSSRLRKSIDAYIYWTPASQRHSVDAFSDLLRYQHFTDWWISLWRDKQRWFPVMKVIIKRANMTQSIQPGVLIEERSAATKGFGG